MKKYTVDLCFNNDTSWIEESECEQGQYYKIKDVNAEIKNLRDALLYTRKYVSENDYSDVIDEIDYVLKDYVNEKT